MANYNYQSAFNAFNLTQPIVTAGSSFSSYRCCLEPWRELIGFIWFLWHCYCMEEIKDNLK